MWWIDPAMSICSTFPRLAASSATGITVSSAPATDVKCIVRPTVGCTMMSSFVRHTESQFYELSRATTVIRSTTVAAISAGGFFVNLA